MAYADKKAANGYNTNYKREHYDVLRVLISKGGRSLVKTAADAAGESMSVYIKRSVAARLKADGLTVPEDF